ncbi:MAG: hypothetical protein ACOZQL_16985 [Myxococcota bacterium]
MRQSTKSILLWLVLIIVFVAIYATMSGRPREPLPACETRWSSVALNWSVPSALFLGLFGWLRWQQRRFIPAHEGVRLMGEGRHVQALEVFERARATHPDEPANVFNCAAVELVLWKLDAAMKDFARAKVLNGAGQGQVAVLWAEHFALACALVGRVDEGLATVANAPRGAAPSRLMLAEGALLVRSGRWAEARARLNSLEVKQLGGSFGALARALDALCVEQLSGELRHVDRVGLFGEAATDEARRHWPELLAFVERAPAW